MNSDASPEAMGEGECRYNLNVRVSSSENANENTPETVKGNTNVVFTLPVGNNIVIGAKEDKLRNLAYYFVYNSGGEHSILEFNTSTLVISKVFQDGVSGNAANILNFSVSNLITGINIIALTSTTHLLYWTDFRNEPRKINIEKGKLAFKASPDYVNGYKHPFDTRILYRVKQPPLYCPDYAWTTPPNSTQFIASETTPQTIPYNISTLINYNSSTNPDFDVSTHTWSITTTGVYSINTITLLQGYVVGTTPSLYHILVKKNGITIGDSGLITSTTIHNETYNLLNTLLVVGDVIRIEILNLTTVASIGTPIPITGTSLTPLLLGLASNVVINHSFKKLFQFKTQFVYDDYEVSAWSPISKIIFPQTYSDSTKPDDIIMQDYDISLTVPTGSSIVKKIRIAVKEVNDVDFKLVTELDKSLLGLVDDSTYNYTFLNDGNYIPIEINESIKLFDSVPLLSQSQELIFGNRLVDGLIKEGYDNVDIDMRLQITYGLVNSSVINNHYPKQSYLKAGGGYTKGIVYYDLQGNRSGVTNIVDGDYDTLLPNGVYGTKLSIPFLTNPSYAPGVTTNLMSYVPIVSPEIYNTPPTWANHYKILRSKNQSIVKYLQFTSKVAPVYSGGFILVNILNVYIDYLAKYPNSNLVYDFTKGDRIRFIAPRLTDTTIGTPYAFNDSEILSFDASSGVLQLKDNFGAPAGMNTNVLLEIYTPRASYIVDNELMYEVCEEGTIKTDAHGNRVHSGGVSNALNTQLITSFVSATYTTPPTMNVVLPTGHGLLATNKVKVVTSGYSVYGTVTSVATNSAVITTSSTLNGTFNGVLPGTITKAATTVLSSGDCFRRVQDCLCGTGGINTLLTYVEASNVSNMFASNACDYGRPNRIDKNFRQVTRPSTIIFSEILVPETFINGLSSVYDSSYVAYNSYFGGIYKLHAEGSNLFAYQERKIMRIGVNQTSFVDPTTGARVVGLSEKVLQELPFFYEGEYGIGKHPESFAYYGIDKYNIDVNSGVVLRLSTDGLTPISEIYKMNNFFMDKCKEVRLASIKIKIYGVYDIKFGEYIISFENRVDPNFVGATLAFNEKRNLWSTFYSYLPEIMCGAGLDIITFKSGQLYLHNHNTIYNMFYGVNYSSKLQVYCNVAPSNIKTYNALALESFKAWKATVETPISAENPIGQTTSLIENNFQLKEGFMYSEILRNDNTPNIVASPAILPNARFEGDPMRAQWALIKLQYDGDDYEKIAACNVLFVPSPRNNE